MAKLCIFGANGQTGQEIIKAGLTAGHEIVGAVRRANSLDAYKDRIDIREYDFGNDDSVAAAMRDCDVALSAIGSGGYSDAAKETSLYSTAARALIRAARTTDTDRLVIISSAGVDYDQKAPWYYRFFFRPYLMNSYMDMMRMETILEESAKDLRWTIVRPTYLLDGEHKTYDVRDRKIGAGNFKIFRVDVADFMVDEATANNWVRKHPTLGYRK